MVDSKSGWINGFIGVLIFSGSLPATRLAVTGFSPVFLTSARAAIAALLGALFLRVLRQSRPSLVHLFPLFVVAVGGVVGFPFLTALALQRITAAHSIVYIGLLPLTTALFGVWRGGEHPQPVFWIFSIIGALTVAGFALFQSGGGSATGDLLMIAAVLLCGLGYAEGAKLSRVLGGWQVISWALLLSLPVTATVTIFSLPTNWGAIGPVAWISLGYVSVFSMLVGFVFWYRGLALGGIAGVGQLQLLQPFLGLLLASILLHEAVAWTMIASTCVVVLCVAGAKRFAQKPTPHASGIRLQHGHHRVFERPLSDKSDLLGA